MGIQLPNGHERASICQRTEPTAVVMRHPSVLQGTHRVLAIEIHFYFAVVFVAEGGENNAFSGLAIKRLHVVFDDGTEEAVPFIFTGRGNSILILLLCQLTFF